MRVSLVAIGDESYEVLFDGGCRNGIAVSCIHYVASREGCPGEWVSVSVNPPRSVFDGHVLSIVLKFHGPADQSLIRTTKAEQPLKSGVIGNKSELGSVQVHVNFLNAPDDGETLQLSDRIILFGIGQRTRDKCDGMLLSSVVVLGKNRAQSQNASIDV